jgi:hypothetical protein
MPLHLHLADPPQPEPTRRRSDVGFAVATISSCLAALAATYWFLGR